MASKQTPVTVSIKSIEFDNMDQLVVVTTPNSHNPKGSYVMNAAQEARLLKRVGLSHVSTLKHLVKLANGTAKLSFIASENKSGDVWDNGKIGAARKSGSYTKDWTGFSNHEIDLGFIANTMIAEMALKAEFENPGRRTSRIITPVVANVTADVANATDTSFDTTQVADTNEVPNV